LNDRETLTCNTRQDKDASVFYNDVSDVRKTTLKRWLTKARKIQWDYKNLIRRMGRLERVG